jgi:hypothetical protein
MIRSTLSKGIFSDLISKSVSHMSNIPDNRKNSNATKYNIESAGMGALSVFLMQQPSFLSHQKRLSSSTGQSNFTNLFGGVKEIPSANQIRNILDEISPNSFNQLFDNGLESLKKDGLKDFKIMNGHLIALDGTEYYSSQKIKCDCCSSRTHKDITTYHHSMVAASIVNPNIKEAIALIPEIITPQDGHKKQDCENAAIKRWLTNNGKRYKDLNPTILGDDLLSRQPICEAILEQNFNFILVCKPDSHKTLFDYIDGIDLDKASFEVRKRNGKKYRYEYKFINRIPIKDGKEALMTNWLEIREIDKKTKKVTYKNSFITNHIVTQNNVKDIASSGRCRWKIENENNNTLKTKGYHFEHNYGHGKKNLSSVFATLAIIAFLYHTIMNISDTLYLKAKESQGTRENFYNTVKAYTQLLLFESWDSLMSFIIKPPDKLETMKF